ncbi:MAG TPA: gas vesicle protein [Gemmatimonadaceae bacterium]
MSDDSAEPLVLSDLVNRVLDKGVVINGHVTISIADIDLLEVDLRLLLTSVETASRKQLRVAPPPKDATPPLLPPRERR